MVAANAGGTSQSRKYAWMFLVEAKFELDGRLESVSGTLEEEEARTISALL